MTALEIKTKIKELKIDRRVLAAHLGICPAYLSSMLNQWQTLKQNHYDKIVEYIAMVEKTLKK